MNPQDRRELLEATHSFPGVFTIKIIGPAHAEFVEQIVSAARGTLKRDQDVEYTLRPSAQLHYSAVSLQLTVQSADEVLAVYEALQAVRGVKLIL